MAYPQTIRGEGPVVDTLRLLVEDGDFSFIELTHIKDRGARSEVRDMLRESGKGYAYGAQPCLLTRKQNLNDRDNSRRLAAVDTLKSAVDEAVEIGAQAIAFLSGEDPGPNERSLAKGLLKESVRAVCGHAREKKADLKVILESFDRVPFGKNALIGPTAEAVDFVKSIRKEFPSFSLLLDLSHLPLLGEKPDSALSKAKDVLGHVHIGNCVMRDPAHPAYGDEHPVFGIEGGENGAGELADFLKGLEKIGYLNPQSPGVVGFEVKPLEGQESAEVIARAKETLNEAWKILDWPQE